MEAVNTMTHNQHLQMHLWNEATRKTIYVQNRLFHSAFRFKTPQQVFFGTGKKSEISHLEIFGCLGLVEKN
jgi:hypothetical protein